jgi:hypothetical protein
MLFDAGNVISVLMERLVGAETIIDGDKCVKIDINLLSVYPVHNEETGYKPLTGYSNEAKD